VKVALYSLVYEATDQAIYGRGAGTHPVTAQIGGPEFESATYYPERGVVVLVLRGGTAPIIVPISRVWEARPMPQEWADSPDALDAKLARV
jgi:hypothetical protein